MGSLRPGTPEFESRAAAIQQNLGLGPGTSGQSSQPNYGQPPQQTFGMPTPNVQPPSLNLNTNVAPPPPVERFQAPTSNDSRLSGLANEAGDWQHNLSSGSDSDATLALQRAKDLQAGQRSSLGDQLALQGGFGGVRNQKLAMLGAQQGRDLASLNADLTSSARDKQNQAFQTRSGLEQNVASERLNRGQLQLGGTTANNQAEQGRWNAQQAATQAAQGLNLQAWQSAQNASAEQQRLAMQAQESNNQNLWKAFQLDPNLLHPAQVQTQQAGYQGSIPAGFTRPGTVNQQVQSNSGGVGWTPR